VISLARCGPARWTGVLSGDPDLVRRTPLSWGEALSMAAAGRVEEIEATCVGPAIPVSAAELRAPLRDDCVGIYCVGANYLDHARELQGSLIEQRPSDPVVFFKQRSTLLGPEDDLQLPASVSLEFDWEVELGVVVGAPGRGISEADAFHHVAGYCVVNDVTARDLQRRHQQWFLGKNVEGSTPVGPSVLVRDSVAWPPALDLHLRVDGVEKQQGRTDEMIFGVAQLLAIVSSVTTLRVGDVIATGTPAGVGFRRDPPEFLGDGAFVEASVQSVGTLANRVVAGSLVSVSGGMT
jgi:2-keto-4-pentenoate hydratase/2-oxohepta-3-ene-1,7-dioic acid hydratase in catechol pathway